MKDLLQEHHARIQAIIRHHAGRLDRTGLFSPKDRDDLAQDLWAYLLERLRYYRPERCRFPTFVTLIIERHARDRIRVLLQRKHRIQTLSLFDLIPDGKKQIERLETISDVALNRRSGVIPRNAYVMADLRHDLGLVISRLPTEQQRICHLLQDDPTLDTRTLAKAVPCSRRQLLLQLKKIKRHFQQCGLDEYLGSPRKVE